MSTPKQNKDLLGKGIRSLLQNIDADLKTTEGNLKTNVVEEATGTNRLAITEIVINPKQPRRDFDETALKEFDSTLKVNTPLRSKKDQLALRNAVENGTIDVIVSDHCPLDTEAKELEFDLSEFGMLGLQTAFSSALEGLKEKNINAIVRALTTGPRTIRRTRASPCGCRAAAGRSRR